MEQGVSGKDISTINAFTNMQRKMKDSGIPWIGMIPEEWEVCRIKSALRWISLKNHGNERVLSLYRDLGIVFKDEREDNRNVTSEKTDDYKFVEPGDFVINKMKAWQGSMAVSKYQGIVSPAYYVAKFINPKIFKPYFHYLLRDKSYTPEYLRLSTGLRVGQWDLQWEDFCNIKFLIPPLSEQEVIASWLDEKCGEIDELIDVEQKMIEELETYRQATITETVTRGLNPDAPMRQTGIPWAPTIPKHWKESRVGMHFNLILGKMLCPKPLDESYTNEPYFCAANVHFRDLDLSSLKYMWFSSLEKNAYEVKSGDLLIVEGGAGAGGCCVINEVKDKIYIQNSIIIARPSNYSLTKYLAYLIESFVKDGYIDVACNKATFSHYTKEKVANTPFIIPPLSEQRAIADYLDTKCKEIDDLIEVKREKIETLKQYRQSIIFEAVTGKLQIS